MMPSGGSSASKGLGELKIAASTVSYVIVVTQARVHCLICTHDARGRAAPEGKCGHIR